MNAEEPRSRRDTCRSHVDKIRSPLLHNAALAGCARSGRSDLSPVVEIFPGLVEYINDRRSAAGEHLEIDTEYGRLCENAY